jgi:hypothetical protein
MGLMMRETHTMFRSDVAAQVALAVDAREQTGKFSSRAGYST